MGFPDLKGYASYSNYYDITNKSNEGLLLLGAKTKFNTNTTLSFGVGNDCNIDANGNVKNKPALEVKATQDLGNAGNVNFTAQARYRRIDGNDQYRGVVGANYQLKNGAKPYAATHFTTKNGVNTTGGWVGCSYKNVSMELQGNYNLNNHSSSVLLNCILNVHI